jgi:hypothetical protein
LPSDDNILSTLSPPIGTGDKYSGNNTREIISSSAEDTAAGTLFRKNATADKDLTAHLNKNKRYTATPNNSVAKGGKGGDYGPGRNTYENLGVINSNSAFSMTQDGFHVTKEQIAMREQQMELTAPAMGN